jgi:hypothetical protein
MEPNESNEIDSELKSNLFRSLDLQENPQKFSIDSIEAVPLIYIEANITDNHSANTTRLSKLPNNHPATINFNNSGDLVEYDEPSWSRTHSTVKRVEVEKRDLPYIETPRDCMYYLKSDANYAIVEFDGKEYVVKVDFQIVGSGEFMSPLLDDQNIIFSGQNHYSLQHRLETYSEFSTGEVTSSSRSQHFRPTSSFVALTGVQKAVLNTSIPISAGVVAALSGVGFLGTLGIVLSLVILLLLVLPTRENRREIQIGSTLENSAPISESASIDSSDALDLMDHKETVEEVREHNNQLPIEATVEISADRIELVSTEEEIDSDPFWTLETDSDGTYNKRVVEFFKYLGFEKELDGMELETQIFPSDEFISEEVPVLSSSSRDNDWLLVPEPISTPQEREIPEEPTLSQTDVDEQLEATDSENNRLLSVAEADHS